MSGRQSMASQLVRITRAPEADELSMDDLRRILCLHRKDTEWDVTEVEVETQTRLVPTCVARWRRGMHSRLSPTRAHYDYTA